MGFSGALSNVGFSVFSAQVFSGSDGCRSLKTSALGRSAVRVLGLLSATSHHP